MVVQKDLQRCFRLEGQGVSYAASLTLVHLKCWGYCRKSFRDVLHDCYNASFVDGPVRPKTRGPQVCFVLKKLPLKQVCHLMNNP